MKKLLIFLLLIPSLGYSATRNIVPRGTGEGWIGLSTKTWAGVYADQFFGDGSNLTGQADGLWVATATYALNGGGGGGVVDSTAVIDGLPIGTIIQYSTTTAPDGYLYCDGSYVSTTTYSELFAVVGHRFSTYTVTGSPAVFQLPDFRGMFARGAEEDGFRVVGSTQTDTMQGHWHTLTGFANPVTHGYGPTNSMVMFNNTSNGASASPITDGINGTPRISTETRPENIAVAYMIKYGHVGTVAISSSSLLVGGDNTFTGANTFASSVTFTGAVTGISKSSTSVFTPGFATTSVAPVCATGSTITLTTNGGLVLVGFSGYFIHSQTNGIAYHGFVVDGTLNPWFSTVQGHGAGAYDNLAWTWPITLSSGTHTLCPAFWTTSGTLTVDSSIGPRQGFYAISLP